MFCKNSLTLLAFAASTAFALNDWNKPCFDGRCSYDLPATPEGQHGTLRIWGATHAITDITPASGWVILGCDPNALQQTIRIACQGDESDINGCGHLFHSLGESGKLVRLPENCGKNAFGRLSSVEVDKDQRVPSHLASRFFRRAGQPLVVRSVTLDTKFHAIDVADTGPVNMTVDGATYPGAPGDGTGTTTGARRAAREALFERAIEKRGFWDWIDGIFDDFNDFDFNKTGTIPIINVAKNFTLIDDTLPCPAVNGHQAYTATFHSDLQAKANAKITVGVAAAGTIIPPDITEFGVFAAAEADFSGILTLSGTATGNVDTGMKQFWSTGVKGLDFPGILSIGPSFTLNGQAKASLDIGATVTADLCYTLINTRLFYPKSSIPNSSPVNSCQALTKLIANPNIPSSANIETHFEPKISISISAFDGVASASVFLSADANANATFSLSDAGGDSTFNGCFDIKGGLNVNAGADASFFGLFDESTSFNLFNGDAELYNKCWNAFPGTRRSVGIEPPLLQPRTILPRSVSCPPNGVHDQILLVGTPW